MSLIPTCMYGAYDSSGAWCVAIFDLGVMGALTLLCGLVLYVLIRRYNP